MRTLASEVPAEYHYDDDDDSIFDTPQIVRQVKDLAEDDSEIEKPLSMPYLLNFLHFSIA